MMTRAERHVALGRVVVRVATGATLVRHGFDAEKMKKLEQTLSDRRREVAKFEFEMAGITTKLKAQLETDKIDYIEKLAKTADWRRPEHLNTKEWRQKLLEALDELWWEGATEELEEALAAKEVDVEREWELWNEVAEITFKRATESEIKGGKANRGG